MANSRTTLVVGIGNPLRGDDGVGPWISDEIEAMRLPGVETIAVHQLLPELAPRLAEFSSVILVDAVQCENRDDAPQLLRVAPERMSNHFSHLLTPARLLELSKPRSGEPPEIWLLSIPVSQFELGQNLSNVAIVNSCLALQLIQSVTGESRQLARTDARVL